MSKERIAQTLLDENVNTVIKYHSPLPDDITPWYVYTGKSGHRVLCIPKGDCRENMTEADYEDLLVSAPVKTVLRGYTVRDGFIVAESGYSAGSGFVYEADDREFETPEGGTGYALKTGELYLPGVTSWPEAVEYNYFSGNHELRLFVQNPSRYITEVIRKMPLQMGLFSEDDIILFAYSFTDYKKQMIPVHGYTPFSVHLVPENLRTLPEKNDDPEHEELLRIHLVDAATGILRAMRTVNLSPEFSAALCNAIIEQGGKPLSGDYEERLQKLDGRFPDTGSLMKVCRFKCAG